MQGSANLNIMIKAARKAGRSLVKDFREVENLQVSRKGAGDFVSRADLAAEAILREELLGARPTYGYLGEETKEVQGEDPTRRWIVDPLDGTTNFLHGQPHFAISIAVQTDGVLQAALVYDPIKDEMFCAERGQGATMNNRPIRSSGRDFLPDCLIGVGAPYKGHGNWDSFARRSQRVVTETSGLRRSGAASLDLAYVACGRLDAFCEDYLKPWDIAAGALLVTEARGLVSSISGAPFDLASGEVLATNQVLQPSLVKLLNS